jgi:hypothetical protein
MDLVARILPSVSFASVRRKFYGATELQHDRAHRPRAHLLPLWCLRRAEDLRCGSRADANSGLRYRPCRRRFTIPISIANVAGLTSFQFDLAFDPTIITALGFTDIGTDFDMAASTGGGSLTGITGFVDNTTGLLSGIADSIGGLITGNGLTPAVFWSTSIIRPWRPESPC